MPSGISTTKKKLFPVNISNSTSAFWNTNCLLNQLFYEFVLYLCIYACKIKFATGPHRQWSLCSHVITWISQQLTINTVYPYNCREPEGNYSPLTICLCQVHFLATTILVWVLAWFPVFCSTGYSRVLYSLLGSTLPVRFLNTGPRGNPVKCRFPDCNNTETTMRVCMRWCRDETQAWLCWPTAVPAKRCWEGADCGKHTKCHKMNKQTSILGGFFSATDQPTESAREQGMESNEKLQWED